MKTQSAIVPSTVPTFESLLEKMTPHFQFFARRVLRLKSDNFDDAIQELTTLAFDMYHSLVRRGLCAIIPAIHPSIRRHP